MKKLSIIFITLALIAGAVLLVVQKKHRLAAAPATSDRPLAVRTAIAELGSLEQTRSYLGRVDPWQVNKVSSQITSRVIQIPVKEGDRVRKGDTLLLLDDQEMREAVEAAQAQVQQSRDQAAGLQATVTTQTQSMKFWEKELARDEVLAREGAIAQATADATADHLNEASGRLTASQKSLQSARSQIQIQEKRLAQTATRLAYAEIKSPFDGVVTTRAVDPGDLAVPGKVLFEIEDQSLFKLCFNVPQSEIVSLQEGMSVWSQDRQTESVMKISRIYPALNPDRTVTVEVHAPAAANLRSGSYLPVEVNLKRLENVTLIPEDCLLPSPKGEIAVFTVEDGVTRAHFVKVLATSKGISAVDGLSAGTNVIRSTFLGWNRLAGGEPVEVIQ